MTSGKDVETPGDGGHGDHVDQDGATQRNDDVGLARYHLVVVADGAHVGEGVGRSAKAKADEAGGAGD